MRQKTRRVDDHAPIFPDYVPNEEVIDDFAPQPSTSKVGGKFVSDVRMDEPCMDGDHMPEQPSAKHSESTEPQALDLGATHQQAMMDVQDHGSRTSDRQVVDILVTKLAATESQPEDPKATPSCFPDHGRTGTPPIDHPLHNDLQATDYNTPESPVSDLSTTEPQLPTDESTMVELRETEPDPPGTDEPQPQPTYFSIAGHSVAGHQSTGAHTLDVLATAYQSAKHTKKESHPIDVLAEERSNGLPAPSSVSEPDSPKSPTTDHGSVSHRQDKDPGTTDIQANAQGPSGFDCQSVPSEVDARLDSDNKTPYQSNINNVNEGNADDNVISPVVSTQPTLSTQSTLLSATPDWPPGNQEEAARLSLLDTTAEFFQEHAADQSAYNNSFSNTYNNNDYSYNNNNYSYNYNYESFPHSRMQDRYSPILLPSDSEDIATLGSILDQQDFGYALDQGVGVAFERVGSENSVLTEWINSDEWQVIEDQNPYY
ncbi:hypothetical protein BGX29_007950 [Mortierella sp. GBA35]|nr:hypothetical protein BGX29_007950 [Mortierella sp. GBA35]